jgi:hypothetical protein
VAKGFHDNDNNQDKADAERVEQVRLRNEEFFAGDGEEFLEDLFEAVNVSRRRVQP